MSASSPPAAEHLSRVLCDSMPQACVVVDDGLRCRYANAAAVSESSRGGGAVLIGERVDLVWPWAAADAVQGLLRRGAEEGAPGQLEIAHHPASPDAGGRWRDLRVVPVSSGAAMFWTDVTGRRRLEQEPLRLARALDAGRAVRRAILTAEDEVDLLAGCCRAVVSAGYIDAWIALTDGGELRRVVSPAGPIAAAEDAWRAARAGRGPVARALRDGRTLLERASAGAALAVPLLDGHEVQGVLALHASEPDAFPPIEVRCLEELGHVVGSGIVVRRQRAARQRQDERIAHLVSVLRSLRNINQLITRERDPQALVERACALLVQARSFYTSSIVLLDERAPRLAADAGGDDKLRSIRRLFARGVVPDCMRSALRSGAVVVRKDPTRDCRDCVVNSDYETRRHAVVVPLASGGHLLGALHVALPTGLWADVEEVQLVREVADDIAFALRAIESDRQRTTAVAALDQSEATIRAVYDHLPGASFLWTREGEAEWTLTAVNRAATRMTGGTADECIGRGARDFEPWFGGIVDDLAECAGTGAPRGRQIETRLAGAGDLQWLLLSYALLPSGHVLLYAEDVTELRQAEAQLRVSQRLEAVGRLAGGVAHDFNNLLLVIINYSEFAIADLPASDSTRQDLEEVARAGRRAADLTRQLLAFSRKQILEPELLDVNDVVRGIEGMLRRLLGEDILIETHLCEELGTALADPGQLEQVIMNLAVNARDAMPTGGRLTIETANAELDRDAVRRHPDSDAGRFVLLAVTDTGCGMDAETREQVFEPFFTTKEAGKGTGLGLSTVYGVVKQTGGQIHLYSEPGQGTTFKIYLPRQDGIASPRSRPTVVGVPTGEETLLLVEDDDAVRRLAQRILVTAGYRVLSAASGEEALALAEQHGADIDLLVTDVVMPGMSGRELSQRLGPTLPRLRVLFMSGYTDNAIVHHGVLDPGTHFCTKPFTAAGLARKVREVLDGAV